MTPDKNPKKAGGIKFSMYWAYAIIIVFLVGMLYIDDNSLTKDVSFTKFEQYVATGGVDKITVYTNTNRAEAVVSDSLARTIFHESQYQPGKGVVAHIVTDIPSADKLQDQIDQWRADGKFKGEVTYVKPSGYNSVFWSIDPIKLLTGSWLTTMSCMPRSCGSGGSGGGF